MTKATSPLSEQAASEITDMILVQHRFRPGDKLPNEMELAQELGISRITLREAIRVLCTQGLVEIQRGRGTFVLSGQPAFRAGTGAAVLELTDSGQRDILELRTAMEPLAAYCAAKRATDEELREIDDLRLRMEELAGRNLPFLRERRDFHDAIAAASHNPIIRQMLEIINRTAFSGEERPRGDIPRILGDQRELVRCLQARNAEGARAVALSGMIRAWREAGLDIP